MKQRTCKICRNKFTPDPNMFLPPTCEKFECRIAYSEKHLNKKAKEKKTKARVALRQFNDSDINILKRLAQKLFNQYIRFRDKDELCISCDYDFKNYTTEQPRQAHAGHYRPQGGNSLLRYTEDNCFKQCSICNNYLSANLIPYRENLIKKIGINRVEELESLNTIKKWSKKELDEIIKTYRQKVKVLLQSET